MAQAQAERILVGDGHDRLILQDGAERFPEGTDAVGLPWICQVKGSSVHEKRWAQLPVELEFRRYPKSAVSRLDGLVHRSYLRAAIHPDVVENIGGLVIAGGEFHPQGDGNISLWEVRRVEQPVPHGPTDICKSPGKGGIPFIPPMFVQGGTRIDHRGYDQGGIYPVRDSVGGNPVPGMGVVDHLGLVRDAVRFFLGTPEMPERFKVPVIGTEHQVAGPQHIGFRVGTRTAREMPDCNTALRCSGPGHKKYANQDGCAEQGALEIGHNG